MQRFKNLLFLLVFLTRKLLVILGFLWGIGNIMTAIAHSLVILELIYLVAFGAFIFAPLWGFMEGFYLLKMVKDKN